MELNSKLQTGPYSFFAVDDREFKFSLKFHKIKKHTNTNISTSQVYITLLYSCEQLSRSNCV